MREEGVEEYSSQGIRRIIYMCIEIAEKLKEEQCQNDSEPRAKLSEKRGGTGQGVAG